eukprot:Clim_evm1s184 gene=Clim_evmTU1s184
MSNLDLYPDDLLPHCDNCIRDFESEECEQSVQWFCQNGYVSTYSCTSQTEELVKSELTNICLTVPFDQDVADPYFLPFVPLFIIFSLGTVGLGLVFFVKWWCKKYSLGLDEFKRVKTHFYLLEILATTVGLIYLLVGVHWGMMLDPFLWENATDLNSIISSTFSAVAVVSILVTTLYMMEIIAITDMRIELRIHHFTAIIMGVTAGMMPFLLTGGVGFQFLRLTVAQLFYAVTDQPVFILMAAYRLCPKKHTLNAGWCHFSALLYSFSRVLLVALNAYVLALAVHDEFVQPYGDTAVIVTLLVMWSIGLIVLTWTQYRSAIAVHGIANRISQKNKMYDTLNQTGRTTKNSSPRSQSDSKVVNVLSDESDTSLKATMPDSVAVPLVVEPDDHKNVDHNAVLTGRRMRLHQPLRDTVEGLAYEDAFNDDSNRIQALPSLRDLLRHSWAEMVHDHHPSHTHSEQRRPSRDFRTMEDIV